MRVLSVVLAALVASSSAQAAADRSFDFQGDHFAKVFEDNRADEHFVEFTQAGENVQNWTKLFVLHWFPNNAQKPEEATAALAGLAAQRNQHANALLSENAAASEAVVHFMAQASGSDVVEVDAFKYAPAAEGHGLVAVQYAFRFTVGKADPAAVRDARMRAVEAIKRFDMNGVRSFFAPSI